MAVEFENQIPEWENEGTEPTSVLKKSGFTAGYKPPSAYFNWFWSLVLRCIKEIQTKFKTHADNTSNPHGVTAAQVGLGNVPNVKTNDQTPTYSDTNTLETLQSGEKLNVSMQKIKCAITNLINHIQSRQISTYATWSDIGQTIGSETLEGIANGMPANSVLTTSVSSANAQIYPNTYGVLRVTKRDTSRVVFEFFAKPTNLNYVGFYDATSTPVWTGWGRVLTSDTTSPSDIGALPKNGSEKMTGSLKIKDYGEIDGNSTLTYLKAKKDANNFRYLRIINPLLTDYTVDKAIQWGNVTGGSEKTYDIYGDHNLQITVVSGVFNGSNFTISYPSGFNKNNCFCISAKEIKKGGEIQRLSYGALITFGDSSIGVSAQTTQVSSGSTVQLLILKKG